jgi:hypothetical protein
MQVHSDKLEALTVAKTVALLRQLNQLTVHTAVSGAVAVHIARLASLRNRLAAGCLQASAAGEYDRCCWHTSVHAQNCGKQAVYGYKSDGRPPLLQTVCQGLFDDAAGVQDRVATLAERVKTAETAVDQLERIRAAGVRPIQELEYEGANPCLSSPSKLRATQALKR